jgi:DDE superfamily endonuclease
MEEVLDLYAEPDDPQYPVVCFDERPYQLGSEVRQPVLAAPGPPVRYDDANRREGTGHVCMFVPPLGDWRHVKVTDRRTAQDVAPCRKELVDSHFPQATLSRVVLDHLHTPTPAALYETCAPAEARRMLQKLDVRYPPSTGAGSIWRKSSSRCCQRRV